MYETVKVIRLSSLRDVENFVRAADGCDFDIDVKYNHILIDGKSLIGMIGLGLLRDIQVCYGGTNENFENVIERYEIAL